MKAWLAMWLIASTPAGAATLDGVYSNVCVDRETRDQDGLQLQLRSSTDKPLIAFKTCEGGCWRQPTHDVSVIGNTIAFLADDQDFSATGKLVEAHVHRFSGVFDASGLRLGSANYWKSERLGRLKSTGRRTRQKAEGANSSTWPAPVRTCGR